MYLADTSVWVDFLRGVETARVSALKRLLAGDDIVGVAPIIVQEILQGADSEARFERWRRYFAGLACYAPADPLEAHIAAARLYQACRRAGKTPRSSSDCLIARIAIEHRLVLLHDDRDFDAIASVTKDLRIYPAR
ncbi:MAG: PIN domain-containing protein [Burkholderiales bacterium]|nr:PIN domain-containing protein [Burkholderiales bacterium]